MLYRTGESSVLTVSLPLSMILRWPQVSVTRVVGASGQHGLVLVYNPSQSIRSPLVLALSRDGGAQWSDFATLESDATVPGRWYAYPTIVQHGGHVYCSYTVYDHLPEGGTAVFASMPAFEARHFDYSRACLLLLVEPAHA